MDKRFSNYKVKLSDQIVKSLGKSIIKMYSMGASAVLGMTNQDALSKDLVSDPFPSRGSRANFTTDSVYWNNNKQVLFV